MKITGYLKHIDSLIFALAGYYIVYLFTRYDGVGISPDAIMYTSTARNLHAGHGFHFFNGNPIVDFPVFYPIFLALVYFITGTDPIAAGPVLDGILFAGTIFMSGWLMQRYAPKAFLYKWLILAALLLNPALLQVYTYLWSETLFIFLTVIFFIVFTRYLTTHKQGWLIASASLAAVVCITRYAGVTVIGAGGLLLLTDRSMPFRRRWKPIIIFGLIASSLLIINLVRNRFLSGNSMGPRETSITPFADNFSYFGSVLAGWVGVADVSRGWSVSAAVMVLAVLVGLLLWHTFRKNFSPYLAIVAGFALIYGAFIIFTSTFSRYERINDRLLSPMYIPLLWALTLWITRLPYLWPRYIKLVIYGLMTVLALYIGYQLYKIDYQRYDDQFDYGNPGYTDDSWKESEIVAWMKQHPEFFKTNTPIYSDAYEAIYFFTGHTNLKLLPHRYFDDDIKAFYAQPHYYLIWFNDLDNPELISLKDIVKKQQLKLVAKFKDGAVYER